MSQEKIHDKVRNSFHMKKLLSKKGISVSGNISFHRIPVGTYLEYLDNREVNDRKQIACHISCKYEFSLYKFMNYAYVIISRNTIISWISL